MLEPGSATGPSHMNMQEGRTAWLDRTRPLRTRIYTLLAQSKTAPWKPDDDQNMPSKSSAAPDSGMPEGPTRFIPVWRKKFMAADRDGRFVLAEDYDRLRSYALSLREREWIPVQRAADGFLPEGVIREYQRIEWDELPNLGYKGIRATLLSGDIRQDYIIELPPLPPLSPLPAAPSTSEARCQGSVASQSAGGEGDR